MRFHKSFRLFVLLLAPILGGACIAEAAGPVQTPQIVVVTNTGEPTRSDQETSAPDLTPTPTVTLVTMTAGQDLSCVTGPDWKLYEWVTRIHEGETVPLVARAVPEIPDYYVAQTGDGQECWAFGGSSVLSGPVETLPVRETPPPPTVSFIVRNRVNITLSEVYIRPAGDSAWGADRLAAAEILSGGEAEISITAGYYDILVKDENATPMFEGYNRAIGADDTYRILEVATDVEFTIRNELTFNICRIEIRTLPDGPWQDLYDSGDGGGPILIGDQRTFTQRAGLYVFRVRNCESAILGVDILYLYPGMDVVTFG